MENATEYFNKALELNAWQYNVDKAMKELHYYQGFEASSKKQEITNGLMAELFLRLANTRKEVLNDTELSYAITYSRKKYVDDLKNENKIYSYETNLDNGKQERVYQPTISFDEEFQGDDGITFSLKDKLTKDDITQDLHDYDQRNALQVVNNVDLFDKRSQNFVTMLFVEGSEMTRYLMKMDSGHFEEKIQRLEQYIEKHRVKFDSILTGEQKQHLDDLQSIQHFTNLLMVGNRATCQKWLEENQNVHWVEYLLNEVVDNHMTTVEYWDVETLRDNSYQFLNSMNALMEKYQKELLS